MGSVTKAQNKGVNRKKQAAKAIRKVENHKQEHDEMIAQDPDYLETMKFIKDIVVKLCQTFYVYAIKVLTAPFKTASDDLTTVFNNEILEFVFEQLIPKFYNYYVMILRQGRQGRNMKAAISLKERKQLDALFKNPPEIILSKSSYGWHHRVDDEINVIYMCIYLLISMSRGNVYPPMLSTPYKPKAGWEVHRTESASVMHNVDENYQIELGNEESDDEVQDENEEFDDENEESHDEETMKVFGSNRCTIIRS